MEKKPKSNKSLKEKIDNKSIEKKDHSIEIDLNKNYVFISNGKFALMPKGSEHEVSGEMALNFLNKGLGEIKQ